jgi:hypothetical protein
MTDPGPGGDRPDASAGEPICVFFLAHAGCDTDPARVLRNLLHPAVPVFLDACDLAPGEAWDTELPLRQRQSRATVALLSASTETAYYLREEIASAIAYARHDPGTHRLIPVYLDGTPQDPARIPYGLRQLHALDARRLGGMEGVAAELRKVAGTLIRAGLPSPPPETPAASDRIALFEALCRLLDPQFEEVIVRCDAPKAHLPPPGEPLARRALDLVQWAEQGEAARVATLREAIRQVAAGAPGAVTDIEVYEALCRLLPSQFDEVVRAAGVPRHHIPPPGTALAERADRVVAWMQQSAGNREHLLGALERVQGEGGRRLEDEDGAGESPDEAWIGRLRRAVHGHGRLVLALVGVTALTLAYALLALRNASPVNPAGSATTTLPTAPPTITPPRVDPRRIVRGTIQVPPQNAAAVLTAFSIAVESGDETESVTPDAAGGFRVAGIQEGADVRLTWSLAEGHHADAAYILWPLRHPAKTASPYDGFSLLKLTDVVESEKSAIHRDVRQGRHGLDSRARRKAEDLRELFAALEGSAGEQVEGVTVAKRELKLWQDIGHAAAELRSTRGRSQISDDQIELERVWRRYQITVAAGRDLDRDLVRALNGWALFSRQAYSRSMAAWPARPLAVDMLEDPHWLKRAQDDLDLVLTSLAELRPFLEQSRLLRRLDPGDRLLYDRLSVPGDGDAAAGGGPETVVMSRLVHLLAALNTVVEPGEPRSGDR